MKKITVLQVIAELGDGGVETMLMELYRNIDREKFRFVFVVQNEKRKYEETINEYGGKIVRSHALKDIGPANYIKELVQICKQEHVDVVHAHNLTQNPIILFAALMAGVKVRVSHSHLTCCFSRKAQMLLPLIRFSINILSTKCLACGQEAGTFLYGKHDFIVVNNAVDLEKYQRDDRYGEKYKEKLGYKDKHIILHVGRLAEQKNHEYLFEILEKIAERRTDIILVCCGDGPDRERLEKRIKESSCRNQIYLLGSRNDVPDLMKAASVLLLPSLYEGLPVTLIEAQASGLRCIVSTTVDPSVDQKLGLVEFLNIGKENISEWAQRVEELCDTDCNVSREQIAKTLTENGYNGKITSKIMTDIYSLSTKR